MEYTLAQEIYNKRCSGKTITELVEEYKIKRGTIQYYQNKFNFKIPKGHCSRKSVNNSFFDLIDTEIKAYLLGFFIADGCINKDNRLSIQLAVQDLEILTLYKEYMNLEYEIKFPKKSPSKLLMKNPQDMCCLRWKSPEQIQSLKNLGIVRGDKGKTYEHFNLPIIDNILMKHMIRGITDGDGSWRCQDRGIKGISRGYSIICSSEELAKGIKQYFELNCIFVDIYKYKTKNMYTYSIVCYKQQELIKIYNLLYDGSNFFLKRKKLLAYYTTLTPCKFRELKSSELCNA